MSEIVHHDPRHPSGFTPCPDWCQNKGRPEQQYGERHFHIGAKTDISAELGCWVWQAPDGSVGVYVADGDHTPQQARQLAAGLLKAADLAQRIAASR